MEAKGFDFAAIPQTAIKVLTSPSAFFKEMPKTGGYVEPLIFMLVIGVIGGLIRIVLISMGIGFSPGVGIGIMSIIMMPVFVVVFGFVMAAIFFAIWKLMGSQESYETAFRCMAYISAITPVTTVIGIVPYIGSAIGTVLMIFFLVVASVEVHKIPSQKAWLVFGIIGAVLIILGIGGRFAAKKALLEMDESSKAIQKQTEEMQKKSGEAQKAAEEMQKAMEKQAEEAKKAMEEAQKQTGTKQ